MPSQRSLSLSLPKYSEHTHQEVAVLIVQKEPRVGEKTLLLTIVSQREEHVCNIRIRRQQADKEFFDPGDLLRRFKLATPQVIRYDTRKVCVELGNSIKYRGWPVHPDKSCQATLEGIQVKVDLRCLLTLYCAASSLDGVQRFV